MVAFQERGQDWGGPSVGEAATQADDFIPTADAGAAGFAGAKGDERAGREVEIEDFDGAELAIGELDAGEVGRVQAEEAVCGDVDDRAEWRDFAQQGGGGGFVGDTTRAETA